MKRWLSLLLLASLVGAQLSAVACPVAHHTAQDEVDTPEQHAGHSGHVAMPAQPAESVGKAPVSHHGDASSCEMMVVCSALAMVFSTGQILTLSEGANLSQAALRDSHTNAFLSKPTPPPKLA